MNKSGTTYVAGHVGLVGSAILRKLESVGFTDLLIADRATLDLRNQAAVDEYFETHSPQYVFLAAAHVGGIHANDTYPAEFIRDNLQIQTNVIDAAYRGGAEKLLFLGSSCVYPRLAPQPMTEDRLLTGPLEETNRAYAVAKIAGIEMCRAYRQQYDFNAISVMPTNLYGPEDNFSLENSHVLPALLRKFHAAAAAKLGEATVWGTGQPRREFLHVDDMADACVFLMENYEDEGLVNVGWGEDVTIKDLAELVAAVVRFKGEILFDETKPDGTPRKLLDVSKIRDLGWEARIALEDGIRQTYAWFLENVDRYRD